MVAMMSFHTEKCRNLVSEHEASAMRLCCSVHQFLIYSRSIFVLVKVSK